MRCRAREEAVLVGLEDELAVLDLRHAALLQAADEHGAGDAGAACAVRRAPAVHAPLLCVEP